MSRSHAVHRIGLIGGESTGKSTLAQALAARLPACVVDEGLRDFVEREGRPPLRDEQSAVLLDQQAREEAAADACPHETLIADPAPLMTAVYSLLYFDDPSLVRPAADLAAGYSLVVWCRPDIPWTADEGHRDGPDQRAAADRVIADLVRAELEPRGIRVVAATGSVAARVTAVTRAWQPGGPSALT
jgi:nicotinamide riboside kinase